jgi:hypothetical protein
MSFQAPALPPIARPIRSLIAAAQNLPPEVSTFPCIDPIETAADKLSALAWRVCTRERGAPDDDATVIRLLHDLAALEHHVAGVPAFASLVRQAAVADTGRGGAGAPADPIARFAEMLRRLKGDALWANEYEDFVRQVSFAGPDELIGFNQALAAVAALTKVFGAS